jgi:nitrile hydratase accessory protein
MSNETDRQIANMDGNTTLPRTNGELVFEAPWEGRAFGIAVGMNEDGLYEWGEFRDLLVVEIASAELAGVSSSYYERWLTSLEKLVITKGFMTSEELDSRTSQYASGDLVED